MYVHIVPLFSSCVKRLFTFLTLYCSMDMPVNYCWNMSVPTMIKVSYRVNWIYLKY